MTDWSKRWDKKEKKMDEADMATVDDEPEKEKVEVVTEEEKEDEPIWSGMYCVFCHDFATFIYDGNSICHTCYNEEVSELIKEKLKKNGNKQ